MRIFIFKFFNNYLFLSRHRQEEEIRRRQLVNPNYDDEVRKRDTVNEKMRRDIEEAIRIRDLDMKLKQEEEMRRSKLEEDGR